MQCSDRGKRGLTIEKWTQTLVHMKGAQEGHFQKYVPCGEKVLQVQNNPQALNMILKS